MKLYHINTGLPKGFNADVGTIALQYTKHAELAALNDRYGRINLPTVLDTQGAVCFEVGMVDGSVAKLAYRLRYDAGRDLVLVVVPMGRSFRVLTVWFNLRTDKHQTLDLYRYEKVA